MPGYTYTNKEISYYLHEAAKGNAKYAHKAAVAFKERGYKPLFVQRQFKRAAELEFFVSQRWLGILGLCHRLQSDDSTFSNEVLCQGYDDALTWLNRASANNDPISKLILAKCKLIGIGMDADEAEAEHEIIQVIPYIAEEDVVKVAHLFELVKYPSISDSDLYNNIPLYKLAS